MTANHRQIRFDSNGILCDAWFFDPGAGGPLERSGRCPVVVMAHGFGGTKDSGLAPFAHALRDLGLAVFAFDYRGFGASGGQPRQRVSMAAQLADYRAAIEAAGRQPGVDPGRVVLWGVSMSGGHALTLAADRPDVCAVIAMVPLVSGPAAGVLAWKELGAKAIAGSTVTAVRSALSARLGREPVTMPLVGRPGDRAALTAAGYRESYLALAGPTWRNEVDAAVALELGGYRVGRHAGRISAPVLVQIADFDRVAPPHAAAKVAFKARAEVRHYPGDHFDLFPDRPCFAAAVEHQRHFLRRHLADTR
ncbi:alpha/beta hydrolase [Nocardia wallacei]|uniref:Putative hydrolase, alpha/beta fold protein n=1 Tax=Nocardia wallacei TaxID=480035 RepID=A0A7G1KUZ8_9NOCA|nr:alpha/beta fold hydrolase [Nocardia wallacei]BCK58003.1 putative hydrolase, alpha/beta fold protein [Nocardia wallacei]